MPRDLRKVAAKNLRLLFEKWRRPTGNATVDAVRATCVADLRATFDAIFDDLFEELRADAG